MIVAAISYKPDPIELGVNVLNIKSLSLRAATAGAKLIVFPELALGGQSCLNIDDAVVVCQSYSSRAADGSIHEDGGFALRELADHARKLGIYLVVGYIEYDCKNFYNSVIVFGPQGVLGNVRKTNLYGRESLWASSGVGQRAIINLPNCRLGILAGNDLVKNKLDNGSIYQPGSVDVVVSPTAWYGEYSYPDAAWMEASSQLKSTVIVANRWGFEEPIMLHGGAVIIDRDGPIYSEDNAFEQDCIVYGEV